MALIYIRYSCGRNTFLPFVSSRFKNVIAHNGMQTRFSVLNNRCRLKKSRILLGIWPFALFQKTKHVHSHHELSQEVMSHIPKEVFKKDVLRKPTSMGWFKRLIYKIWNLFRLTTRFIYLMCLFSPLLITFPLTMMSRRIEGWWLKVLLWSLEHAGPTFIKLGQWVSTRRDLFSKELCEIFSKLHDHTRTHSWRITKRKLRKAFGKRWRMLFEKFEQVPVGSGCIGQVHRAYMCSDMIPDESIVEEVTSIEESDEPEIDFAEGLEVIGLGEVQETDDAVEEQESERYKDERRRQRSAVLVAAAEVEKEPELTPEHTEGMHADYPNEQIEIVKHLETINPIAMEEVTLIPVAVKVMHPGIYHSVMRDLTIMRWFARVVEFILPSVKWLSASESVEEFAKLMIRQIDLRHEADCLDKFVDNFESNPNVRFPRPVRPYCKRDVMVMTLEEGEPISNFLDEDEHLGELAAESIFSNAIAVKQELASIGIDTLLQMIFVHNFVHGDLHPGNILVQNAQEYSTQETNKVMVVDMCDTVMLVTKPTESPLRLVLLDAGISTSLDPADLKNLRAVIIAVLLGQDRKIATLMLEHAKHQECQDVEKFKDEMSVIVRKFRKDTLTLRKVKVGELLSLVFNTCAEHKVKIDSSFASILLAIFVLEGIGRSLDPELDILSHARKFLIKEAL